MFTSPIIRIKEFVVRSEDYKHHWHFSTLTQATNTRMCMFMFAELNCEVWQGYFNVVEHFANDNNPKPNDSGDSDGYQQPEVQDS